MLVWYRETYEITAGDAAAQLLTRMWTPDGIRHDPLASGTTARRQRWSVHQVHVYVLRATTGLLKQGLYGGLVMGLEGAGSYVTLPDQAPLGLVHPSRGLVYEGAPFIATHGVGWIFWKGALAQTDKVGFRILYEPVGPIGE